MFFELIHLSRCTRFKLRDRKEVKITPSNKVQMILGTNGSGKSSLAELGFSALVPSKDDFEPGGFAKVCFNHKGYNYTLSAQFDGSAKYSFIKEGEEERNPGGTPTIQRELVFQEFGLNAKIQDLFMGRLQFTEMTARQRRDWIAELSQADFHYALKLHQTLSKEWRGAQAVVKHNLQRIAEERVKLMEPEVLEEIKARAAGLTKDLNTLFNEPMRRDLNIDRDVLMAELQGTERELERLLRQPQINRTQAQDLDQLRELIREARAEYAQAQGIMTEAARQLQEVEIPYQQLKALDGVDLDALIAERASLQASLAALPAFRTQTPSQLLVRNDQLVERLIEALTPLTDALPDEAEYEALQTRIGNLQSYVARTQGSIENIEQHLRHAAQCDAVQCPSCRHEFKPGINQVELDEGEGRLKKGREKLAEAQGLLNEASVQYQQWREIRQQYGQVQALLSGQAAWGLRQHLDTQGGLAKGSALLGAVYAWRHDVDTEEKRQRLQQKIDAVNEAIDRVQQVNQGAQAITQRYQEACQRYQDVHQTANEHLSRCRDLDAQLEQFERFDRQGAELTRRVERLHEQLEHLIEQLRVEEIDALVAKLNRQLAMCVESLNDYDVKACVIKDLEVALEKAKLDELCYKRLIDELSPKDGMIAERITHQINSLVVDMNAVIDQIWGYPLVILPCGLDGEDLDYMFPMYVGSVDNPKKDVSQGSLSMKSIINLAFRLVAYRRLHLSDFPLYLDEVGNDFDPVHKHNMIPAIKDLVDDVQFSQVIMISHFLDAQLAFPGAEVIILDDSHVQFDRPYNQHVEFG